MNVSDEALAILVQQDMKTLSQWWCDCNRSALPDELKGCDDQPWPIMCWIMEAIGFRECLRTWNKLHMDDETFNDFWRGTFEGHEASKQRHRRWAKAQYEPVK